MQRYAWAVLFVASLALADCKLVEELPDKGPAPTEGVVGSGPLPVGTTQPTATPTSSSPGNPTPTSAPTDPPAPTAPPSGDTQCSDGPLPIPPGGQFVQDVVDAENAIARSRPDYFRSTGCVYNTPAHNMVPSYYNSVIAYLNGHGLHAVMDQGGEIGVKQGNDFSEQYHLLTSSACLHSCPDCYRATCKPAWF